ncbi:MAG: UDP-N-acetylmuramoyl-L-alanine--D-glutamate ligase [Ruminococcaceae bacterium]|nr:UDP-N-acetylmuramoyl-L-alanine--D-glutamate ligase [Oscillospiraceae bacterium]
MFSKGEFDKFKNYIQDKTVAVLGLGISNMPLIEFLNKIGVSEIIVFELKDDAETVAKVDKMIDEGLIDAYHIGKDYLSHLPGSSDVVFKTPIVRFDTPELLKAEELGAVVTSEIELLMQLCPCTVVGITGSDGKTTTTTVISKILSESGKRKVWVGGNIGTPLLRFLPEMKSEDIVVLELSSFQLMNIKVSPEISVITNISPNHLDVHKSYEEYIDAKARIFNFQNDGVNVVLNKDNSVTAGFADGLKGDIKMFSYVEKVEKGAWFEKGMIYYSDGKETVEVMSRDTIRLLGRHNVENFLAAICAVFELVSVEDIKNVATEFAGVAHRMQFIRELDGVKYYNSSIDSSPNRTINALSVFNKKNIVLIAGGKDKNIPYDEIGAPIADKVKVLILTGPTAKKIEQAVYAEFEKRGISADLKIIHCINYEEAVKSAYDNATDGDNVVLSPASTSFDMFRNFEERGNCFADFVKKLPY